MTVVAVLVVILRVIKISGKQLNILIQRATKAEGSEWIAFLLDFALIPMN